MSQAATEFISKFHNFQGITIGERKKECHLLYKEYKNFLDDKSFDEIIKNLKPTTYLENKLFVQTLIDFRQYTELLNIFRKGNESLMNDLWKQHWFFKMLLEDKNAEFIVSELFQEVSYVTRMRFLKNIIFYGCSEVKVDEIYDLVKLKYGFKNADQVLLGCSMDKILKELDMRVTRFSNKQLIFLFTHKKDYLLKMLKLHNSGQIFDFYDFNSEVLSVIGGSDFQTFFGIYETTSSSKIGKRLTRKILNNERAYIIKNAGELHKNLHQRTLLKELKSDFKKFFFETWPRSIKHLSIYNCLTWVKFFPKTEYLNLIQEGLQSVYGKSIYDQPNLIVDKLLESIADVPTRESLLEVRIRDCPEEYTLIKFYGIEKSIPMLKKKIRAADGVKTRENLIEALVDTCRLNNNQMALWQVQEYFSVRHRNEDESIRSSFLYAISSYFSLSELTGKHWEYILELLRLNQIKNERTWKAGNFFIQYIIYHHKNGATATEIQEYIMKFISDIIQSRNTWNVAKSIPELEKLFLITFVDSFQSELKTEEERTRVGFQLFKAILDWNIRHPTDRLDFWQYPVIKESIKESFQQCSQFSYMYQLVQGKIACDDEDFLIELEIILWKNFEANTDTNFIEHLLRRNPGEICNNVNVFLSALSRHYMCDSLTIWRLLKHYDHLGLPEKTLSYFKPKLGEGYMCQVVGIGLATLMDPLEYIQMMTIHVEDRVDTENEEEKNKYRLLISLLTYAKYLNCNNILKTIVDCCKGDYLHTSLAPLYYYFFHSAEKDLLPHLKILATRAVSVRKHAVKLACSVSPVEVVHMIIKQMTEDEKNQSVIQHLFTKTFKYFLIDQSDSIWNIIQMQIRSLDIEESNTFEDVCSLKVIPEKFKMPYFQFVWELLEQMKESPKADKLKEKLMSSLTPEFVSCLPYEFCSNLIKQKFMKIVMGNRSIINDFVLHCLKYGQQKERIMNEIFDIINEFKKTYILQEDVQILKVGRSFVERFICDVYFDFASCSFSNNNVIVEFNSHWNKIFAPADDMKNYVKLTLLMELSGVTDLNDYVIKVGNLFVKLATEFGVLGVIDCFVNALSHLLPDKIFGDISFNMRKYALASKLIEMEESFLTNLLAIKILPREIPESIEYKNILFNLIQILKKSENMCIRVNLNLLIDSLYDA